MGKKLAPSFIKIFTTIFEYYCCRNTSYSRITWHIINHNCICADDSTIFNDYIVHLNSCKNYDIITFYW